MREEKLANPYAEWLRAAVLGMAIVAGVPALAGGIDELPQQIRDELYNPNMIDPMQPWTIGYAGNTWRAAVMKRLQEEIIPKWKKLGLIKDIVNTQSNLNDSTP